MMLKSIILLVFWFKLIVAVQEVDEFKTTQHAKFNTNDDQLSAETVKKLEFWTNTQIFEDSKYSKTFKRGISQTESKPFFTKIVNMNHYQEIAVGNECLLKCEASGNPKPDINWTKDGKPIDLPVVRYTNWSLVIEFTSENESGMFECSVCNILGCIHSATTIKVYDKTKPASPYMKGRIINIAALANTMVTLTCPVVSRTPFRIQWAKLSEEKQHLKTPYFQPYYKNSNEENFEELIISNVTQAGGGLYQCKVTNEFGSLSANMRLDISNHVHVTPITKVYLTEFIILSSFFTGTVTTLLVMVLFRKLKKRRSIRSKVLVPLSSVKLLEAKEPLALLADSGNQSSTHAPIVNIIKHPKKVKQSNFAPKYRYKFQIDKQWEIPRSKILLVKKLGEGAFGEVVMAEVRNLIERQNTTVVAVKMLKEGFHDSEVTEFVREVEVMKHIGRHKNIINLLGCSSSNGRLFVVVEYAVHGSLQDFLRNHRSEVSKQVEPKVLTTKELVDFACQIARGMEYLASKWVIHRDLAARNVLVCEGNVLKVADFGLARDIHGREYYRKTTVGMIPIRWMAPESIENSYYNSQSDVWSFGVLLWEIMTLGESPYVSLQTEILLDFFKKGKRLERPPLCSSDVYRFMEKCWQYRPEDRPTFGEAVQHLEHLYDNYLHLDCAQVFKVLSLTGQSIAVTSDENLHHTVPKLSNNETNLVSITYVTVEHSNDQISQH